MKVFQICILIKKANVIMQGFGIVEVARSSQILGQVSSKSVWFFALK